MVGACGLVVVSWMVVEVLAFAASSSPVILSALLFCKGNRAARIKKGSVKNRH